jgi:hypothetical protein
MDIPCTCGHKQKLHGNLEPNVIGCTFRPHKIGIFCMCLKYSPDNLSYVENLAKRKGLV